ncbi:MAG: bifunctional 5,10-methylenetetrahydrofolate dehydrogenase/5,10-methenyltetrahydrofolate cyclohydrolase [Christensenellaceae bacterium]|jgi:methylenetetrahydrofolate dehydrogenase (NADP+)/methenyltetrahydrofolate cyclohydrolase|nr:bifunctional 5,10-methylenetetrahydrofolate dehydrogenase/5,10-methenyltetrahydrofolate cyclohydrolase [Christensenellaceae bacterium]
MIVVDGKALAKKLREEVRAEVQKINEGGGRVVFAGVLVGDNESSKIYVANKKKACEEAGIEMRLFTLPSETTQAEINALIEKLSADEVVCGILVQLPLPAHLNAREVISKIDPRKDVDGLTCENFGRLCEEKPVLAPCTAKGILHILKTVGVELAGANVCVIGRSLIVGKPTALLLQAKDATVSVCHKKTKNLKTWTKTADVIVVAAGCPNLLTADMVKKGVVVVDVGINRLGDGKIVGDCDFERLSKKASVITPVPGGVGPLTIAFLLDNILTAYKIIKGEK